MPSEEISYTVRLSSSSSYKPKILQLTRKNLLKQFASLTSAEVMIQHFATSNHPEWYYADIVLFVEPHHVHCLKVKPELVNEEIIITQHVK